jgi:hypothetical protein
MGIPNPESARYSSLQEFISFSKSNDNAPSFSNLFSVHFASPPMLLKGGEVASDRMQLETGDNAILLDYYAKTVNLPSKQVTTGQAAVVGSAYKYATGTAFSQISMNFILPRSQKTRNLFERWTSLMANDANQYTDYYMNYVCPRLVIYKWERGGGDAAFTDPQLTKALRDAGNNFLLTRKNKLVAAYVLENVFPYNIGSMMLNNDSASLLELNVQFYYERYRFFTEDKFDDPGYKSAITLPARIDDVVTPESSNNTTTTPTPQPIPGAGTNPTTLIGAGTQAELNQINSNIG